jgi:restriction system protein
MAIPDFQSIMLPLLTFCADGQAHTHRESIDVLAQEFGLTEDEQKQLLPSGQQLVFHNRVAWARSYMKMANLLENTRRGVFRITERGTQVLGQSPSEINVRFLRQFPEFIEARASQKDNRKAEDASLISDELGSKTPAERLEEAYMTLRENLASELISQLKSSAPISSRRLLLRSSSKWGMAVPEKMRVRPSAGAETKELMAS